ncbi:MAG: hypothetical protein ACRDJV_13185 [Actinomycetota bacterium]
MKHSDVLSNSAKTNVVGLVLAAAGIVVQIVAGSDLYPSVPPGPIIVLAGAGVVAFGPRRWAPYVAVFVPVFLLVGATISAFVASESFVDQLSDVGEAGIFTGTLVQMMGVVVALAAGIAMWRQREGAA